LRVYRAELHVHTVLSPCAEVEMIPPLIVSEAGQRGIDIIAITDHNSSANVLAVQKAAANRLIVLPGMELQTREEVHILCLFDTIEQILAWQHIVDRHLPALENNIEAFGEQFVVDETGDFVRREPRMLLTSTDLSFKEAVDGVHDLGGLAIPAHVDRKAFSLISNLGFVPADTLLFALEVSRHLFPEAARAKYPQIRKYPLIQSGDVHRLDEYLGVNYFELAEPSIREIKLALTGLAGRSLTLRS
jgi:3',5'-nucleoside bisphosphate phosphatase